MNWDEAVAGYLEAMQSRKRPRTLYHFVRQVQDFRQHTGLESLAAVREADLIRYVQQRSQTVKIGTAWGYLGRLLPLFRWANRHGHILWNPGQDIKVPQPQRSQRRVLTCEEVIRLLEQPSKKLDGQRDKAILEVFYGSGLRLTECADLDVSDVDLEMRHLKVREGKGGAPRLAPIGEHLAAVLRDYLDRLRPLLLGDQSSGALWLNNLGQRLHRITFGQKVHEYGKKAGLDISTHSLRHAYATHLLEGGASLRLVQIMLGHRSLLSTQIYTHLLPQELLREYRRTHPRAKRRKRRAETL